LFGPYVENFKTIADEILSRGAGFMARGAEDLLSIMTRILTDPEIRQGLVEAGKNVLEMQKETMEKAARFISEIVWKNSRSS